jgi:phosphate:Na+ symporter
VVNTLLFLPFVRVYARLLERVIPDKPVKEAPHLTTLDLRLIESPIIAIENSRKEIIKMGGDVDKMLGWTRQIVQQDLPDDTLVRKVFHREDITDVVQQEVIAFVTDVLTGDVPHATAVEGRQQLRVADEFESMADYIVSIVKGRLRLHNEELGLTPAERDGLLELHDLVTDYVKMIAAAFEHQQTDILTRARAHGKQVTAKAKDIREQHMQRQTQETVHPLLSMVYVNLINAYRKIRGHALNIAEAVADVD